MRLDGPLRTVVGAEALLRWEHPRLGLLAPGAFLPMAEDIGLGVELDLWAVRSACARAAAWAGEHAAGPVQLSVNLGGRTLVDPRLLTAVRTALVDHDLDPRLLCLEVVESQSLVDVQTVAAQLTELRRIGVRVALDDFGTGYSTLSWLQQLPVDRIKLDRTFTTELPGEAGQVLVRGVVALARELGIDLVAEGVETHEQLEALAEAGCRLVQGHLLARPSPELVRSLDDGVVPVGAGAPVPAGAGASA